MYLRETTIFGIFGQRGVHMPVHEVVSKLGIIFSSSFPSSTIIGQQNFAWAPNSAQRDSCFFISLYITCNYPASHDVEA